MSDSNLKRCSGIKYPGDKTRVLTADHYTEQENFSKNISSKDGLRTQCKTCTKIYDNERKNLEKVSPSTDLTCRVCGEIKHNSLFRNDSNNTDGKARVCFQCARRQSLDWQRNNPEKKSLNSKNWRSNNPAKRRVSEQRRRARLAEVHLQDVLITELLERYDSKCVYCETPVDIKTGTFDHVVPVVNGGFGADFNAVLACGSCNSSKGARTYYHWFDSHHDKRKIVLYPDLYLWSAQWEARSLQLQKYRETVKSPEFIETIKSNPELLEHEYLKTGLASKTLQTHTNA